VTAAIESPLDQEIVEQARREGETRTTPEEAHERIGSHGPEQHGEETMRHATVWIAVPAVAASARAAGAPETLPPRARLRIGTDPLRTPGNIRSFALSPGGRLVAAGVTRTPSPRITILDVPTGRRVKQLLAPENQQGWVETVAFSPDGTTLL